MSEKSAGKEESVNITLLFHSAIHSDSNRFGFCFLYQKIGKIDLFIILLSTSAGGIPFGFIGAFIDYKVSAYKFEKRSFEQ